MIASNLVDPDKISVSYEQIGGLSHVIDEIKQNMIIPARKKKYEKELVANSPKGIFLIEYLLF